MRRIEVATGVWVIDEEAGIGNEIYVLPQPEQQRLADVLVQYEEPIVIGVGFEECHRKWVQRKGWNDMSQTAITAASQPQIEQ